jgi:hypothetical protein
MGSPVKSRAALTLGRVRLEGTDGGQTTLREFKFSALSQKSANDRSES